VYRRLEGGTGKCLLKPANGKSEVKREGVGRRKTQRFLETRVAGVAHSCKKGGIKARGIDGSFKRERVASVLVKK